MMKQHRWIHLLIVLLFLGHILCLGCWNQMEEFRALFSDESPTDREIVELAWPELTEEDFQFYEGESSQMVRHNVTLPSKGAYDTTITWEESADPGETMRIEQEGTAIVATYSWQEDSGMEAHTVQLRATITKGLFSKTKDFILTLYPAPKVKASFAVGGVSAKMVLIPKDLQFPKGINDSEVSTISYEYWIAETEVTYELWYTVRNWAVAHGYKIYEGSMGGGTGVFTNQHPVTQITWWDAIAWCNALTEYYNEHYGTAHACVYVYNGAPLKEARDDKGQSKTDSDLANLSCNESAKGFRLARSDEWELAARYRGTDSTNVVTGTIGGVDFDAMEIKWTKGNSASDAWTKHNDTSGNPPAGKRACDEVAVYGKYYAQSGIQSTGVISTASVKSKRANAFGLYDMSGNVFEWCYGTNQKNVYRGGDWNNITDDLQIGLEKADLSSEYSRNYGGFRIAKTK